MHQYKDSKNTLKRAEEDLLQLPVTAMGISDEREKQCGWGQAGIEDYVDASIQSSRNTLKRAEEDLLRQWQHKDKQKNNVNGDLPALRIA